MAHKDKATIWLVGGGTGGHLIPLLAVAHELQRHKQVRLTYIGQSGNAHDARLAKQAQLPVLTIATGKLRRYFSVKGIVLNIWDSIQLLRGVLTSCRLIKANRPDLIFSKGGPVALPLGIAAWITHTPLITHESDAVMGATNRFFARFARKVLTGFPVRVYPLAYARKLVHVGIPLRPEFCREETKVVQPAQPMILVTGGGQGAHFINLLVEATLPQLLALGHVMHITGKNDYALFQSLKEKLPVPLQEKYGVADFTPDIASYMKEATVVVSRAGSSIFELASLRKPMFLIPLPSAAHDHQVKNAELFVVEHAAVMARQENLTPLAFYETIKAIVTDKQLQQELREGTRSFMSCSAAREVATLLIKTVEESA